MSSESLALSLVAMGEIFDLKAKETMIMSHSLTHGLIRLGRVCVFSLIITSVLGLAYCSNDDNGGGDGPSPDNTAPIFMWYTTDKHNGDFGGVSGADTFCGEQAASASLPNTDRRSYTHRAVLGSASRDPETAFNIPNVSMASRELQRPDGMKIANLYTDYFSTSNLDEAVDDDTLGEHWSALNEVSGDPLTADNETCADWSSSTVNGIIAVSRAINTARFADDNPMCDGEYQILCVSY